MMQCCMLSGVVVSSLAVCPAATWQGRMVAVKIIEYTQEPGQRGPLEGLLSEQVQHPNVVSSVLTVPCEQQHVQQQLLQVCDCCVPSL